MKRIAKRFLSMLLTLCMVLVFALPVLSMTAMADEGNAVKIGETEYLDLSTAVAAANNGDTIELLRDIELPYNYDLARINFDKPNTTYTLLGHGHTITFARNPNSVDDYIGGFRVKSGATLNLGTPDDLEASKLRIDGGGAWGSDPFISVSGEGSIVNMYDGVVLTNIITSGSASGIVQVNNKATFNMFGGELSDCFSAMLGVGGAFVVYGNNGGATLNITGGKIVNNRCDTMFGYGYGAGIYSQYGTVNLSNCEISGNMAVQSDGTTPATNKGVGGGICMIGGTLTAKNCTIKGNHSKSGGGLYLGDAEATLMNCTISGNTAKEGGGILADEANVTLTGCDVVDNVSYDWGGGVYAYGSTMVIGGGSITGNQAIFGGGLVNEDGSVTVESGIAICNNTASQPELSDSVDAAGDDVCNVRSEGKEASLTLPATAEGLTLDPCGHLIDGWYDDGTDGQRWNVDDETLPKYAQAVEPATFTDNIALKAAHNESPKTPGEDNPPQPVLPPIPVLPPQLNTDAHEAYIIGYEDDTVRPENNITRAEVATIFFRMLTDESRADFWSQTNEYTDVSGTAWYNNAISTMSNAGIVTGYPGGAFHPDAPITRAEFAAIAARFSEVVYNGGNSFTDVPENHWAARYIALAEHLGWIEGYPDGTFKPDQPITRAEAMTLINRVLERAVEEEHMLEDMVKWPDNLPGAWYYEAVQEATNSHEYVRTGKLVPEHDFYYENWQEILEAPDWAALEKSWADAHSK